ncbi:MAG TPA: M14-type cytosolic carboxypeptidase, partial [Allosphingosinicella sp.]|nr:M14-type cytosolic carboxypeptidase [Allosphingosinicella sp.]
MTLSISSAFDGGNIRLVAIEGDRVDLEIVKDHQSDFYQWFYFRLTGGAGRSIELRILNAAGAAYPDGWPGYKACVSLDREEWTRVESDYADGVL